MSENSLLMTLQLLFSAVTNIQMIAVNKLYNFIHVHIISIVIKEVGSLFECRFTESPRDEAQRKNETHNDTIGKCRGVFFTGKKKKKHSKKNKIYIFMYTLYILA